MKRIKQIWKKIDDWYWSWDDGARGMFELFTAFIVGLVLGMGLLWLIDLIFDLGWCE